MKEITFKYDGKNFTLNLDKGELKGDDPELLDLMDDLLKEGIEVGSVGGHIEPFKVVKITDPYRDLYQFTACIIQNSYLYPFPKELEPYIPERKPPLLNNDPTSEWGMDFG